MGSASTALLGGLVLTPKCPRLTVPVTTLPSGLQGAGFPRTHQPAVGTVPAFEQTPNKYEVVGTGDKRSQRGGWSPR